MIIIHLQSDEFFDDCCHMCELIDINEIVLDGHVVDCEKGYWPDINHTGCLKIWAEGEIHNSYSISSFPAMFLIIVLSGATLVITAYAVFFFLKRDTKCIRTSGLIMQRIDFFVFYLFIF